MADVGRRRAPSAFLDSLPHHLRHRDAMAVRRSPGDEAPMTKGALVDSLLDDGLGLQSANRLLIELVDNELIEQIQRLYFSYRPVERTETDIPILYLNVEREDRRRERRSHPGPVRSTTPSAGPTAQNFYLRPRQRTYLDSCLRAPSGPDGLSGDGLSPRPRSWSVAPRRTAIEVQFSPHRGPLSPSDSKSKQVQSVLDPRHKIRDLIWCPDVQHRNP